MQACLHQDIGAEERLALAYRQLTAAECRGQKISEIALAAGFSDVSYFNRVFRARFGMTPGEAREMALRTGN